MRLSFYSGVCFTWMAHTPMGHDIKGQAGEQRAGVRVGAAVIVFVLTASPAFAACLKYEPAKVTLEGVIRVRVDFGPPNYGENPKTDSKEPHLYLHLDKTVCVDADGDQEAAKDVKLMEMVYFVKSPFRDEWLGKHVSVSGTLFGWQTAHHHTPVLITPTETHVIGNGK